MSGMQVQVLRKGSQGLKGTLANAEHHAKGLLGLINSLVSLIESDPDWLTFETWAQGHNVSVFKTKDGRKFILRPLNLKKEGYVGLALSLRVSRSTETHLATIYADQRNGMRPHHLLEIMARLAEPEPHNIPSSEEQN